MGHFGELCHCQYRNRARNLILVPGNAWSGGHSWNENWYGTPNAVAMLNVVDPLDNYAYEIHQYLDPSTGGSAEEPAARALASSGSAALHSGSKRIIAKDSLESSAFREPH